MGKLIFDGNYGVHFVPSVANISAPTTTEIDGGTDLTSYTPKDGVSPGVNNNRVSTGDLSTAFDAEVMGTWGSQLAIEFFKDDVNDLAWDTLPRGTSGYIVIAPFTQDPAVGDPVYVWQIETGTSEPMASASNENQRFNVPFACQDADLRAAVA